MVYEIHIKSVNSSDNFDTKVCCNNPIANFYIRKEVNDVNSVPYLIQYYTPYACNSYSDYTNIVNTETNVRPVQPISSNINITRDTLNNYYTEQLTSLSNLKREQTRSNSKQEKNLLKNELHYSHFGYNISNQCNNLAVPKIVLVAGNVGRNFVKKLIKIENAYDEIRYAIYSVLKPGASRDEIMNTAIHVSKSLSANDTLLVWPNDIRLEGNTALTEFAPKFQGKHVLIFSEPYAKNTVKNDGIFAYNQALEKEVIQMESKYSNIKLFDCNYFLRRNNYLGFKYELRGYAKYILAKYVLFCIRFGFGYSTAFDSEFKHNYINSVSVQTESSTPVLASSSCRSRESVNSVKIESELAELKYSGCDESCSVTSSQLRMKNVEESHRFKTENSCREYSTKRSEDKDVLKQFEVKKKEIGETRKKRSSRSRRRRSRRKNFNTSRLETA